MNLFLCQRAMGGREGSPSPALIAAQRRLEQLRKQRSAVGGRRSVDSRQQTAVSGQPSAVGDQLCHPQPLAPNPQPAIHHSPLIPLFPDLALAMLREGLTAAGRIWLLLRYMDSDGRGWLSIEVVQEELTARDSELRVCGRRQLRNLLQQGRGIFWERDRDRVWLKSAAKVATALGVERLSGRPVLLPVEILLSGIGQVRAHFYASFHSGRSKTNPISRDKLEQITGVPARTQRVYDRSAGVVRRGNVAVGERCRAELAFSLNFQERAWRHGRAAFPYQDHDGRFGPAGGKYVAWRLPNSYEGPHDPGPVGRKKKINRQIDLVNTGAQGNGLSERTSVRMGKGPSCTWAPTPTIFHTNGLEAGKAYNRDGTADIYWPAGGGGHGGSLDNRRRWHVLPALKKRW